MKYAIVFRKGDDGIIVGHYIVPYRNFVMDVKSKGHKHDRLGYNTYESARIAGNLAVGTTGESDPS